LAKIDVKIDEKRNLTVFTATAPLSSQEICDELDRYFSGRYTRLVLWDLTRAKNPSWSDADIKNVAWKVKQYSHLRKGGKTAYVVTGDLDFGISRMYQTYADIENVEFEIKIFRDIKKARKWLGIKEDPVG